MKAWAWMAMVPMLGSLAHGETLGDVAKRERERREKKEVTEAKVIGEKELVAGPGKKSKGTFNPPTGSASGEAKADLSQSSSVPANGGGPNTEVEARRAAGRARLESSYAVIAQNASPLTDAVQQYEECRAAAYAIRSCRGVLRHVERLARSVAASMDDAEDAVRQGWLSPGEAREARRRHRMDDSFWDELVRVAHQYRR